MQTPCSPTEHSIFVYILECTSHPLILGTFYFISKKIVLDFDKFLTFRSKTNSTKVRCKSNFVVPPNVAMFVYGRVTIHEMIGIPGICSGYNMFLRKGLLLVKSVVTISPDLTVPIKIMNPSTEPVFVKRGSIMAHFKPIDNTFKINPIDHGQTQVECASVTLSDRSEEGGVSHTDEKFLSYFSFEDNLIEGNKTLLSEMLCQNRDIFVTKEIHWSYKCRRTSSSLKTRYGT